MSNTVDIYTRDYCGYCTRALRLLDSKGVRYTEHNASKDPSLRDVMIKRSGRQTFPQVFIGDFHVGGSDDLMTFERSGKLDAVLQGML
ncbi:glutaredoxin 3 [Acuticoccus kandeliae]|uniref:glutaredoxin 3 n=1 Tax=Acuticoccus kandeliae TaxID=2073160 RepID=UPI000D3E23E4|nr:glutaredoxin 3 [Acuticoccus kandeliae]